MRTDGRTCVAVVITMNRPVDLDRLLAALVVQTLPLTQIVVVDNGLLPETRAVLLRYPTAVHLPSHRNLGGAGGYAYGILHALALGAERIWIMDDDGMPEAETCLGQLVEALDDGHYDMVSPLVLDINDPEKLAFFYYQHGRPISQRSHLARDVVFPQFAHLFNGALLKADAFERYGLPRYELFFRGDEVDFMFRLKRDGARFATIGNAAFLHPSGARDTLPIMGGRYHAVVPASEFARFYFYRNRGNLYREFGLVRAPIYDLIRYGWAFLVTRRGDREGVRNWFRTMRKGWRRDFVPFAKRQPDELR